MSKYGKLISAARKTESQKARKPEKERDTIEEDVNLSIKVPRTRRQHWAAEAKRQGVTLTAAITEALIARFGEPE
jgi:hypothetical protein